MREFSKKGEAPTATERELVASASMRKGRRTVWLELVRAAGLDSVLIFFDHLGTEKIHVPTREGFIQSLARERQLERLQALMAQNYTAAEAAHEMGMPASTVRSMLHRLT